MDWSDRFSSIVRETENNLDRVKRRLKSAKSSAVVGLSPPRHYGSSAGLSPPRHYSSSAGISRSALDQSVSKYDDDNVNTFTEGRTKTWTHEETPSTVLVLHEQINQQNKVIAELQKEVRHLGAAQEQDQRQIRDLKGELNDVHTRVAERGVHVQTEHKLEEWRRDMTSELQLLHSQIQTHRSSTDNQHYSNTQLQSALREIQDIKRFVMDENQSIRREVDSLKTRLVKYEVDLTSMKTDVNEVSRRHDRVDRSMRDISEHQRTFQTDVTRKNDDRDHDKLQIHELRNSVRSLRDKLSGLESNLYDTVKKTNSSDENKNLKSKARHSKAKHSKAKHSKEKAKQVDMLSLSSSSGLSTLSLADYSSDDLSVGKYNQKGLNLDDLDLSDVPSLSASDLEI